MARFESELKAKFKGNVVEVLEDLVYRSDAEVKYVVPAGFVCDLASVPKLIPGFLRILFGGTIETAAAGVLHDWLYKTGELTRLQCDRLFFEALRATEEGAVGAWVMWSAVRLGGWIPWRGHRNAEESARDQDQGEEG